MTRLGLNERTDAYEWTCDGPPVLARGMVAPKGARCGARLELPARVLAEVRRRMPDAEPWEVAQAAVGRDWQMLESVGYYTWTAGRLFCPMHRLAWDDEAEGPPLLGTLGEQLTSSLAATVAAAYERLGIPR